VKILPFTAIAEALEILKQGGVVAHATETCYGFACDLSNRAAVERLFTLKQRATNKAISALFSSLDQAKLYTQWPTSAKDYENRYPGPITLIVPLNPDAPTKVHTMPGESESASPIFKLQDSGFNSVGVRISSHPIAQALVEAYGSPLSTTSVNIAGQPSAYSVEEILAQFAGVDAQPDLVLDSGTLPRNPSSTIIDLTSDLPKILRG